MARTKTNKIKNKKMRSAYLKLGGLALLVIATFVTVYALVKGGVITFPDAQDNQYRMVGPLEVPDHFYCTTLQNKITNKGTEPVYFRWVCETVVGGRRDCGYGESQTITLNPNQSFTLPVPRYPEDWGEQDRHGNYELHYTVHALYQGQYVGAGWDIWCGEDEQQPSECNYVEYGVNRPSEPQAVVNWPLNENGVQTVQGVGGEQLVLNSSYLPAWVPGKYGNSLLFNRNGSNSEAYVKDSARVEPSEDMTVEAWVKFNSLPSAQGKDAVVITKKHSGSPYNAYFIDINKKDSVRFSWRNSNGEAFVAYTADSRIKAGQWYHLAGVKSGSKLRIYINGGNATLKSTNTIGQLYNSSGAFNLGTDWTGGNRAEVLIDEVKVYNYARDPQSIIEDMSQGS
ncbi:LamG domain-containing protein [Candidatus Microgenomates bacterium]|nr:MAG: LamG domain-containing protein [Candidatus Microgenomates bacterium]